MAPSSMGCVGMANSWSEGMGVPPSRRCQARGALRKAGDFLWRRGRRGVASPGRDPRGLPHTQEMDGGRLRLPTEAGMWCVYVLLLKWRRRHVSLLEI